MKIVAKTCRERFEDGCGRARVAAPRAGDGTVKADMPACVREAGQELRHSIVESSEHILCHGGMVFAHG